MGSTGGPGQAGSSELTSWALCSVSLPNLPRFPREWPPALSAVGKAGLLCQPCRSLCRPL